MNMFINEIIIIMKTLIYESAYYIYIYIPNGPQHNIVNKNNTMIKQQYQHGLTTLISDCDIVTRPLLDMRWTSQSRNNQ